MNYEELKLTNINKGAVEDLFNEELGRVLRNINDLNVEADAVREINVKLKIKPSKDRLTAVTSIQVTSKLASNVANEGSIFFSFMGNSPKAYANNIRQMTFNDVASPESETKA